IADCQLPISDWRLPFKAIWQSAIANRKFRRPTPYREVVLTSSWRRLLWFQIEKPDKVFTRDLANLLQALPMKSGQTPRHFNHEGRLIALSAKRHCREVGTIGFD